MRIATRTIVAALGVAAWGPLCALSIAMPAGSANAAEIKVMSTPAYKEAYGELIPAFEKSSGHKVVTIFAGTGDMMKRIGGGETVDLVILPAAMIADLTKQGKLVAGSSTAVAQSGIGVAVRAGAPKIDISSGEALKNALLATKSIGLSSGPSGVYLAGLFQRWGIADPIKGKLVQVPGGMAVGEVVARGEAAIGFQQVSELLPIKGIDFVGPLPADIQEMTVFSAGLHVAAGAPDAAKALVKFLTAPEAAAAIKKAGMQPG
jgi:molybdate transport system substrate-binding protein